jgi:dUTP pyrophosphatase
MEFGKFSNVFWTTTSHDKIMHLSIYVDGDDELKKKYMNAALTHNDKLLKDPHFYDAGFDLFLPKNGNKNEVSLYGEGMRFFTLSSENTSLINKVNFNVKCCAKMYNRLEDEEDVKKKFYFSPFYTYMRSSMSKTPLRLANNQGIIDAGYRGSLIGMFDCIYSNSLSQNVDYYVEPYSRVLQICAPGLVPIYVDIVDTVQDLGPNTFRGEGGFGSTGV